MCKWMEKNAIGSRSFVRILSAGLITALMAIASSAPSMAQEADRVVSDCNFDLNTLKSSLTSSVPGVSTVLGNLQAVTIVVYANNPNFGQLVPGTGPGTGKPAEYTGRVVCMVDQINGVPITSELKAETDPIPENPGDTVDIHDLGQGMALRYTVNPGGTPGIQVCATSNGNGDCVRAPLQ